MWGNSGGRLEGRRRQRGARSKGAFDLAIFCDIFLRKHETQIMIFGYDADLRGLRDCATNAITGARRPLTTRASVSKRGDIFYLNRP
jgi:hypothetical protein